MKMRLSRSFAVSAAVALCLICGNAFAVPVTLEQDYGVAGNPSNRADLRNTLISATVKFDDGSLTGIGTERISADTIDLVFSDRGLMGLPTGLNFSANVLSLPPFAAVDVFKAVFVDGVYTAFSWTDDGGALARAIINDPAVSFGINLISFTGGGGQLSLATPNAPRFNMFLIGAATLTRDTGGPSPVPLPATLPLFVMGLAGLAVAGRYRRRNVTG